MYNEKRCPCCGNRVYESDSHNNIQRKNTVISDYESKHPGCKRICVDGSLWFKWVDGNGNEIDGPKGI